RCRGRAPASIVLQSTINPVGPAEIETDLVKLSERNRVDVIPRFGLVIAEMDSAVRSNNQVVRIDWIDPHRMVIAMDAPELSCRIQTPAAVLRYIHRGAQHVDTLIVLWINTNLAVIHRPRVNLVHLFPGGALVIRTKDSALCVLVCHVNDLWIFALDIDADASC